MVSHDIACFTLSPPEFQLGICSGNTKKMYLNESLKTAGLAPLRRADGGTAMTAERMASNSLRNIQRVHAGPIISPVAGRTDHIPMNVASGSYVIPADIVSGVGQGNTAAGHQVLSHMFRTGPYGMAPSSKKGFARGGAVPIMAAGGEHVLTPEQVALLGGGDLKSGHEALDAWVVHERAKINKEQKKLPGPAKD